LVRRQFYIDDLLRVWTARFFYACGNVPYCDNCICATPHYASQS